MIISHKHKFIYIKTRKTASTSLEIALSKFCGEEDVITSFSDADEQVRAELGYRGPQNEAMGDASLPGYDTWLNHTPALIARKVLGRERWDDYFKFTFERNPFDRAISRYYWSIRKMDEVPALSPFLRSAPRWMLSCWDLYTVKDRIAVDFVGKYEDMTDGLEAIAQRLGLPEPIILPQHRAKGSYRTDRRAYREVLSSEDRSVIESVCHNELKAFGYTW